MNSVGWVTATALTKQEGNLKISNDSLSSNTNSDGSDPFPKKSKK